MSILIKGMEMPTNCFDCPCVEVEFMECSAKEHLSVLKDEYGAALGEVPDWCPLVPVPPHGRLIDADALAEHKFVCIPHLSIDGKEAGTAYRLGWNTAIEAIMENAETIIGGE